MFPKQNMHWCKRWSGFLIFDEDWADFLTRTEQTFFAADWADFFCCGLSRLFWRGLSRLFVLMTTEQTFLMSKANWLLFFISNGNPKEILMQAHLACTAQAAGAFHSTKVGIYINEFWHLDLKCHYLHNYPIKGCMHMLLVNYDPNVINFY